MHVIWTNSLDSMVIAGMKATIILLKTALEEIVPRLHVPHHQIKIGVWWYDRIHGQYVTRRQVNYCWIIWQWGCRLCWDKVLRKSRLIVGGGDKLKVYKWIDFSSRRYGGDVKKVGYVLPDLLSFLWSTAHPIWHASFSNRSMIHCSGSTGNYTLWPSRFSHSQMLLQSCYPYFGACLRTDSK